MFFQFIFLAAAVVFQTTACPCNNIRPVVVEAPVTSYYQPAAYPCRDYGFPAPTACGYVTSPSPCGCATPAPAPCARSAIVSVRSGYAAPSCGCGYAATCGCAPEPCGCGLLTNPCDLPTCGCFKDVCDTCADCAPKPKPACACAVAAGADCCCDRLKSFIFFPEVEYPMTILDITEPFYYNTCFGY